MTWKLIELIAGQATPAGSSGLHVQDHAEFFGMPPCITLTAERRRCCLGNMSNSSASLQLSSQQQAKGNLEIEAVQKTVTLWTGANDIMKRSVHDRGCGEYTRGWERKVRTSGL
jgi:hypothetical protein